MPKRATAFAIFAGFAAGLGASLLVGVVAYLVDDAGQSGVLGDAATWVGAAATTTVAYLAYRTARDAAKVAEQAFQENLSLEARGMDFHLLGQVFQAESELPPGVERIPPRQNEPDWPDILEGGPPNYFVVRLINNNNRAVLKAQLQLSGEIGPRILGRLRQGATDYWFARPRSWHSIEPVRRAALLNNAFVDHLDFTDSRRQNWRLMADGELQQLHQQT